MLADFVLELISAPGTGTITLPNTAPTGRVTWIIGFGSTRQPVIYVLDDTTQEEWGVGTLIPGSPNTITRDYVIRNSAGTQALLNFTASSTRCYNGMPAGVLLAAIGGNAGRNLFHNGLFRVAQRGAGAFTTSVYTADRWAQSVTGGTISTTISALADADRTAIGDEAATSGLAVVTVGGSSAGDNTWFEQRIEDVRRTANKVITVSFWAKASAATPKVGVNWFQVFGTGGSPSANVGGTAQSATLSTTWARYTLTFAVSSIATKTLGSGGNDYLTIRFHTSSGATLNTQSGTIGVQNSTQTFWGIQAEISPAPTLIDKPDIGAEYAQCQRFYQTYTGIRISGYLAGAGTGYLDFPLPVRMRGTPTLAYSNQAYTNGSAFATDAANLGHMRFSMTVTGAGAFIGTADATISADL